MPSVVWQPPLALAALYLRPAARSNHLATHVAYQIVSQFGTYIHINRYESGRNFSDEQIHISYTSLLCVTMIAWMWYTTVSTVSL
ncbi:hypothetical protein V1522DRAFT_402484 [Lipomyces starkeyi]